jgi:ABC-type sugar transport system substrate-binding protein
VTRGAPKTCAGKEPTLHMRRNNALVRAVVAVAAGASFLLTSLPIAGASKLATESAAKTAEPSIWYINPYEPYPLFAVSQHLFQAAAKKYHYKANVAGSTSINIPQQISLINQAVASGANAIIFCDLDPATYKHTILAAEAKHVVMVTTSCVDNISNYSIGTDNVAFGQEAAKVIATKVGKNAQVVVFMVSKATPNQVESYNAFIKYAKSHYPAMRVIATELDNGDPSKTETDLTALPQSYPSANAIWFLEGGTLPAISTGLSQAGKKPGQIFVLGIDAVPTTISAIKKGWISETLAQCYFWATPFAAQLAMAKLAGRGPKRQSWPIGVQAVGKAQLPYNGCPASFIPKLGS